MSIPVLLSRKFFTDVAGWDVVKRATDYVAQDRVLSSAWQPPTLRGVVSAGETSYRAGLVIKNSVDVENLCTCRESREWGKICAHSVALGLHWLQQQAPPSNAAAKPGAVQGATGKKADAGARPNVRSGLRRATDGEPAEINVIFPPNLAEAFQRGRIMLVFEAQWRGGRSPLGSLPSDKHWAFSLADEALLDALETLAEGQTPSLLSLSATDFVAFLPRLSEHPRISLGKSKRLEVTDQPVAVTWRATLDRATGEVVLSAQRKPERLSLFGSSNWAFDGESIRPLGLSSKLTTALERPARIGRAEIPAFLSQDWPKLAAAGQIEADFQLDDFSFQPIAPEFILELQGGLGQLTARLQCKYGGRIMTLGVTSEAEELWMADPSRPTHYSTRAVAAERAARERLIRVGFSGPDVNGRWQLTGTDRVLNFFAREFPRMEREWQVTLEERLAKSTREKIERIEPRFRVSATSGIQWFDLGVAFETSASGQKFSSAEIQRLLLSGQSHTRLQNGRVAVMDLGAIEELQETLLDCAPTQGAHGYRISNTQSGFLAATLRQNPGWKLESPAEWRAQANQQSGEMKLDCPPLGDLAAVLRGYQRDGVAWLHFLRTHHFGGVLADEMGLGKTLQVLALLRATRSATETNRPWLVVCPTSLIFNWLAEAEKFVPNLRTLGLHGGRRHDEWSRIADVDLVVTSYALIRRDAERYREIEFDTVVLDEAQHIKNRQTQNAQAVRAVRAARRLVLTGTPIENSVLDLWSIYDFLMPGYLGSAQDFRERYEVPIQKEKDSGAQHRLARRLRPFLLRRTKREVAPELPPKVEQVAWCDLGDDQRQLYQQILQSTRQEVMAAVGEQGLGRSRMVVLNALLRLRQVCCDARLLPLADIERTPPSAKVELFNELLDEVLDGGHRALVFSQFTKMLALLRERLDAEKIDYCYLDGSTTDRGAVVTRFQQQSAIPIFLISLKAGGVGLNLAGADTVIHFDPWWNPAVEDQATDRAHRIGQTRTVTSYKLIARDTIEEKILRLQQRKREITSALLLAGDEETLTSSLTWEDIQELLA